jgi:hypothetical protein
MKNAVFWNRKTQFIPHMRHYVSVTKASRLMLYRIRGFHCCYYEECGLLGYKT